jgi:hypothetical protein
MDIRGFLITMDIRGFLITMDIRGFFTYNGHKSFFFKALQAIEPCGLLSLK